MVDKPQPASDSTAPEDQVPAQEEEVLPKYEVLSSEGTIALVRFYNPYRGKSKLPKDGEADSDPNPHVEKSVNIPMKDGGIDKEAFLDILKAQARGVKQRMDSAAASNGGELRTNSATRLKLEE